MRRRLLLAVLTVGAAACAPAADMPDATGVVEGDGRTAPATQRDVQDTEKSTSTPDLLGADIDTVRAALADAAAAGLHVVAFEPDDTVTAQYPAAGEPLPEADPVLVWLGGPPEPPPRPTPPPTAEASAQPAPTAAVDDGDHPDGSEATDEAQAPPDSVEPTGPDTVDEGGGEPDSGPRAGGSGSDTRSVPTSGRTSPSDQPPSQAGLALSGPASWYGPGFAGRTTACGGRFDPSKLTLASRELRCGTNVRITGPTGTTVEAQVTDWGPAEWTNRRFDLSQATFAALAPLSRGVVDVAVEVLD